MDSIESIDELIEELKSCNKSDYPKIPKKLNIDTEQFEDYAYFSEECYTRNCIAKNKDFELLLLCWEPDQETPIHCHDSQECWVVMIDGILEEEKFDFLKNKSIVREKGSSLLKGSIISYMSDELGYHLLRNPVNERAMSLHLYVNPINKCSTLCPETGKVEWIETSYYSECGEVVNV